MAQPQPPPFAGGPPPLPPGWTEHVAPAGQLYWFNPSTNVSTYVRPLPPPPPPNWAPNGPPQLAGPPMRITGNGPPVAMSAPAKKEKREKPKDKTPIPGTDWIKVVTNKGNVFYTNKETKASLWTVPEEIKAEVDAMEREASVPKKREREDDPPAAEDQPEPVKEEEAKDEPLDVVEESPAKEEDATKVEEVEVVEPPKAKKQKRKVVSEIEELESDEVWQRQMAEQMAKEAEDQPNAAEAALAEGAPAPVAPPREAESGKPAGAPRAMWLDVTPEEGIAIFKAMLAEKDIQPMAPWDMELPKFVNDPRYQSVKVIKERRDLFDEFCKLKIREQRAAKNAANGVKLDPIIAYRALLQAEVTSTRTHFSDFKRAHAKDSRFREFGKTEGEKERVFRQWLRELGEKKRLQAEKAERDFFEMLGEDREIKHNDRWVEVKARHAKDKRYDAVNSSSLRESLFKKHIETLGSGRPTASTSAAPAPVDPAAAKADRAARAAASLREREDQVRLEQQRAARSAQAARGALGREEAEREFTQLLIEKVRDHGAQWEDVADALRGEARFEQNSLSPHDQRRLFEAHTREMYAKRLAQLEILFEQKSPLLTTPFEAIKNELLSLPQTTRIVGSDERHLEQLYSSWHARRTTKARGEFQELLKESPIIEHWGRLQKQSREEGATEIQADEGEEDENMPDLREMAGQVDIPAIELTLKHDQRYLIWDHEPEMRTRWVEDYLDRLAPPKQTVHQKD